MSCCPPAPPSAALGGAFAEANGHESDIRPGESVECYMARGGNTTGLHDDATQNVKNKIDNSSVPIKRTPTIASVNMQFKLTADSTRIATSWSMTNTPPGLTLSLGGRLTGAFDSSALGQTYKAEVTASDGTVIDTRGFTIAPSIGDEGTQIQFISPLPGAIVNSKFGPRLHPIQLVMKPHTGIDMKYVDKSSRDVVAAADGEVLLAGGNPNTGYGVRVWIKHLSGSGNHLCTTTYNHLSKVYVSEGQKIMAGQKIGLEGSTGSSTGNHLHFECKLPDGKFIDPEPLIRGTLFIADKTLANGDADQSSITSRISEASLSESETHARQSGCSPFGPAYPAADPPESTSSTPSPAIPGNDPFELAWYFTMIHEVGPHWTTAFPSDPDVAAGLIETSAQRKKDGYVNAPNFPGGETKFGIAQKPNPRLVVRTCTYSEAKNTGYNNYWKSSPQSCNAVGSYIAIMLFDMNYLHGGGNARTIYNSAGISSISTTASHAAQLSACQALYSARVEFIKRIPRPEFTRGWLQRSSNCLSYVQALPSTLLPP